MLQGLLTLLSGLVPLSVMSSVWGSKREQREQLQNLRLIPTVQPTLLPFIIPQTSHCIAVSPSKYTSHCVPAYIYGGKRGRVHCTGSTITFVLSHTRVKL